MGPLFLGKILKCYIPEEWSGEDLAGFGLVSFAPMLSM
jgi:hypothetical protein